VLLFQLLMSGNHPFRGRWLAGGDPPPVETRISQGWYPYADRRPAQIAPPPGGPTPGQLHPAVATLFDRCFADGHGNPSLRPTAEEWARTLSQAEDELVSCPAGHAYPRHLDRCPDCGTKQSRPRRSRPRSPGPVPRPASGRRGSTVAVGGAGAATVRPAGWSPTSALAGAWSTAVSPLTVIARGAGSVNRAIDSAVTAVQALPGRAVRGAVGPRPASGAPTRALERGRRTLAWTSFLAIAAAVGGLSVAYVAALIGPVLAANGSIGAAVTPGARAFASAAVALVVVGGLQRLAALARGRITTRSVRDALGRSAVALGGWTAGWLAAALVFAVASSDSLGTLLFGPALVTAVAGQGGWVLGWAVYGASAGALGTVVGDRPPGWATVGAVFGAVGWLALQVAAAAMSMGL